MRINEKHLSLMSKETLYTTSAKKARSSLNLQAAVDVAGPSLSSTQ